MKRKIISLLLCFCVLFSPFFVFAGDSNCNTEFKRKSDRVVVIDCEKYFIFPEKKGRKMLTDLEKCEKTKKQNKLLAKENKLLERSNKEKDTTIDMLNMQLNNQFELSKKIVGSSEKPSKKIWQTKEFHFGLGFLIASGSYYLWQETFKDK